MSGPKCDPRYFFSASPPARACAAQISTSKHAQRPQLATHAALSPNLCSGPILPPTQRLVHSYTGAQAYHPRTAALQGVNQGGLHMLHNMALDHAPNSTAWLDHAPTDSAWLDHAPSSTALLPEPVAQGSTFGKIFDTALEVRSGLERAIPGLLCHSLVSGLKCVMPGLLCHSLVSGLECVMPVAFARPRHALYCTVTLHCTATTHPTTQHLTAVAPACSAQTLLSHCACLPCLRCADFPVGAAVQDRPPHNLPCRVLGHQECDPGAGAPQPQAQAQRAVLPGGSF